jgi:hypothetical protein
MVYRSADATSGLEQSSVVAPVLIPARYHLYQGYPLRIVPDPGTAFRPAIGGPRQDR